MEKSPLEDLFLRQKPARLLVYLKMEKYPYASSLAKKIDATYAHTVKLLGTFKDFGLVSFSKEGRVKFIELTDNGKDLADEFEILILRRMMQVSPAINQEQETQSEQPKDNIALKSQEKSETDSKEDKTEHEGPWKKPEKQKQTVKTSDSDSDMDNPWDENDETESKQADKKQKKPKK